MRIDINRHNLKKDESANPGDYGGKEKSWYLRPPPDSLRCSFMRLLLAREAPLYHLSLLFSVFGWSFYNLEFLQDSVLPGPIWKIFKLHKVYKTKISHIMG